MKISDVVEKYVSLRDAKAELRAQMTDLQAQMDAIEIKLLSAFEKVGVDSVKTPFGTAYTTTRSSATVADKESFMRHVKDADNYELLEIRCAKTAVEQYKEMHGELPPGVNWSETIVVNIRK